MNAVKTLLKILLILLVVFGILFAGIVVYVLMTEDLQADPEPPPEIVPYSDADLRAWVDESWQGGETQVLRNYALEGTSSEALFAKLDEYTAELYAKSPRYWYTVGGCSYASTTYEDYIALTLSINYSHSPEDFDALPHSETIPQALSSQREALASGEGKFIFLGGKDWSAEDLITAAEELLLNSVEIAAESTSYNYYFITGDLDENKYIEIAPNYNVDTEKLAKANAELRAALDEMAQELRAREIGDTRELYRAAAQAIIDKASYDDDTLMATYTDDLSDEQKILRSAYGAVVAGKTVCSGYAMAYKALCDRLELPCWVVDGYSEGVAHAWNLIQLDGENRYIDCTFADTSSDNSYLLMNEEQLKAHNYYFSSDQPYPWAA